MKQPFSVFYRSDRHTYYVAFKNEETGRYLSAISTKKTKESDAVRQAWAWFRDGIPYKDEPVDIKTCSLRDSIKKAALSQADAEFIVDDLKRRGLVLSCVFAGNPEINMDFSSLAIWKSR
ncbi:MAG: hypothetical protein FWC06_08240 [Treponema sp.]|nr:hypothetical protein [Treponema sp.]